MGKRAADPGCRRRTPAPRGADSSIGPDGRPRAPGGARPQRRRLPPVGALDERLAEGRPLRVKLGLDPTAPDIHLGHTVVLQQAARVPGRGHTVVLIVGDYTARVGDPTGRSATRPVLSGEEIDANAQTYVAPGGEGAAHRRAARGAPQLASGWT